MNYCQPNCLLFSLKKVDCYYLGIQVIPISQRLREQNNISTISTKSKFVLKTIAKIVEINGSAFFDISILLQMTPPFLLRS